MNNTKDTHTILIEERIYRESVSRKIIIYNPASDPYSTDPSSHRKNATAVKEVKTISHWPAQKS